MKFVGRCILIISPERWGVNRISKHHYAIALAQKENQVYFLNPPSIGLSRVVLTQTEIPNVTLVDYTPTLKGLNKILKYSEFLFNLLNEFEIQKIKKELPNKPDVVWSFDPFRFQNLKRFNFQLSIFHPVDYYQDSLDLKVAQWADIIISVSQAILDRYKQLSTPNFFINHGVSAVFLNPKRSSQKTDNVIRCGYVGNLLSFGIHWPNLLQIITENNHVEFHFIGPYQTNNLGNAKGVDDQINELKKRKNVILYGPLSPAEISDKIQSYDLFLICYNPELYNKVVSNSHKILEYLSTGKVVVASLTTTYSILANDLIEMVDDSADLPERFKKVVDDVSSYNSMKQQEKRIAFARLNSYENHLIEIEQLISTQIKTKHSGF